MCIRDRLRDIARNLSIRNIKTCIVDERGELGAMNEGVSPFTLGYLCDVLDMYPKAEGIFQALRTLSPRVIILDEIGNLEESESILQGMNSGVGFILSAHGSSLEDIKNRIGIRKLIESKAISQLIVCLLYTSRCV